MYRSTALLMVFLMMAFFMSCGKKEQSQSQLQTQTQTEQSLSPQKEVETKDQIHVAHILIMHKYSQRKPDAITRTKEEAKIQAESLLQKLQQGADFGQLAGLYSDCPSKNVGGDLGLVSKGDMVKDFEDAAFALRQGELSGVVETQFGYHIIKRF